MKTRTIARVVVPGLVGAAFLAPTPAHALTTCSLTGTVTSRVVSVTSSDPSVSIAAVDGELYVSGGGGNVCPDLAITTIRRITVNVSGAVTRLNICVAASAGFGPSATGRAVLPTTVNGGSSELLVIVEGGTGLDQIRSFPLQSPEPKPWGLDMNFAVDDLADGAEDVDVWLDMAPTLRIDGGFGNDVLRPGQGRPEQLICEFFDDQRDVVDFVQCTQDVYADMDPGVDTSGDDGGAGEGDSLSGFDVIAGGSGDDVIVGDIRDNTLLGRLGDDVIVGRGGDDTLSGDEGNDRLWRGDGDDRVLGEQGNDVVLSGTAADGSDVAVGGDGVDTRAGRPPRISSSAGSATTRSPPATTTARTSCPVARASTRSPTPAGPPR